MRKFKLALPSGTTITGRHSIPTPSPPPSMSSDSERAHRPLIVAFHGGSFSSAYFDLDETHSAKTLSDALHVPFVAIDREIHLDLSSAGPSSSYQEEDGKRLHTEILPAVWKEFGKTQAPGCNWNCNSVVLLAHSMGCVGAIVAAGLWALDEQQKKMKSGNGGDDEKEEEQHGKPSYPLAGIILSGWASLPMKANPLLVHAAMTTITGSTGAGVEEQDKTQVVFVSQPRLDVMLPSWSAPRSAREEGVKVNLPISGRETKDIYDVWFASPSAGEETEKEDKEETQHGRKNGREWASNVTVPVMLALASRDELWDGNEGHLKDFAAWFSGSKRVDTSLVVGAPHNLEMSYWAPGWFARCFGFAVECAVGYRLSNE